MNARHVPRALAPGEPTDSRRTWADRTKAATGSTRGCRRRERERPTIGHSSFSCRRPAQCGKWNKLESGNRIGLCEDVAAERIRATHERYNRGHMRRNGIAGGITIVFLALAGRAFAIDGGASSGGTRCATPDDCGGTGARYCVDGYCCNSTCGACGACNGADRAEQGEPGWSRAVNGTCAVAPLYYASASCDGALCGGTSPACPSDCTDDKLCAQGYYCDRRGLAKCTKKVALGEHCPCAASGKCGGCAGPGYCADEVCCDSECTGDCVACTNVLKAQGDNGTCGFVAANALGRRVCEQAALVRCATTGFCDGQGACQPLPGATSATGGTCLRGAEGGLDGACDASDEADATEPAQVPRQTPVLGPSDAESRALRPVEDVDTSARNSTQGGGASTPDAASAAGSGSWDACQAGGPCEAAAACTGPTCRAGAACTGSQCRDDASASPSASASTSPLATEPCLGAACGPAGSPTLPGVVGGVGTDLDRSWPSACPAYKLVDGTCPTSCDSARDCSDGYVCRRSDHTCGVFVPGELPPLAVCSLSRTAPSRTTSGSTSTPVGAWIALGAVLSAALRRRTSRAPEAGADRASR